MTIRTLHLETGRHLLGGAMQTKHLVHGLEERGVPALLVCPDDGELYRAATREGLNVQGVRYRGDHDLTLVLKLGSKRSARGVVATPRVLRYPSAAEPFRSAASTAEA